MRAETHLETWWSSLRSAHHIVPAAFAVGLAIGVLVTATLLKRACCSNKTQGAFLVQMLILFFGTLTYTLIIPSSHLTATAIGYGDVFSGVLIGSLQAGVLTGAVAMWLLLQSMPDIWKSRSVVLAMVGLNLVGASAYFGATLYAGNIVAEYTETRRAQLAWWFCAARFVDGIGLGLDLQMSQVSMVYLFPSRERPRWMALHQFYAMSGLALGPLVAFAVGRANDHVIGEHKPADHIQVIGFAYIGIACGSVLMATLFYPSSLEEAECKEDLAQGDMAPEVPSTGKYCLIFASLLMTGIRAYISSGLESATSLLLETKYGWDVDIIGLAICVTCLWILPLKVSYNALQKRVPLTTWIRSMGVMALLATLLLFTGAAPHWGQNIQPFMLLVADSILFPSIFLADALMSGLLIMSHHLLTKGSRLDANHVVLFKELLKAVGRFIGPPGARALVSQGGQDVYAMQQLPFA